MILDLPTPPGPCIIMKVASHRSSPLPDIEECTESRLFLVDFYWLSARTRYGRANISYSRPRARARIRARASHTLLGSYLSVRGTAEGTERERGGGERARGGGIRCTAHIVVVTTLSYVNTESPNCVVIM